jgi:RIO-like serine/threonine protein kinase
VRNTLGRLLLRRELRALQRLRGVAGTPADAFRIDAHAMAARFLPGRSLAKIDRGLITPRYLERLEGLLEAVHARGVVHLDTRGAGNLLMLPDGTPGIIDFQASVSTSWMPSRLRRLLEELDMAGVYKKWAAWQPQAMDGERRARFESSNRWRKLWLPRGYLGLSKRRRARRPESSS